MSWPLSQDYNEAIQSPASNFSDPDLKRGEAVVNALGLPAPYSGNFADVYQVRCPDGSRWAVKCFTREAAGLRERYQEISAHLKQAKLPFTVDFSYLDQGIRVAGRWYPVLKMQWVEGLTLNQFVGQYLDKPAMLEALLQLWARMGKYLRAAEVGHCDLQHGNVLLVPGATPNSLALKLIDYDGMWVPALAAKRSGEVGHANYQHPQRLRDGTFSLEVDRFPLLLAATAMRALKAEKGLWAKYDNGDNMLFKESDLAAPGRSELFEELSSLPDPGLVMLAAQVRAALKGNLESAAFLEDVMPEAKSAAAKAPRPASGVTTRKPVAVASAAVAPAASTPAADALAFGADEASAPSSFVRKKKRGKEKSAGVLSRLPLAAWIGGGAALALVVAVVGGLAVWALAGRSSPPTPIPPDNRVVQKEAGASIPPVARPDPGKDKDGTPPSKDGAAPGPVAPMVADPVVFPPAPTAPDGRRDQPGAHKVATFDWNIKGPIRSLRLSGDGKLGLALGSNGYVSLNSTQSGFGLDGFLPPDFRARAATLSPDGRQAVVAGDDKAVHVWAWAGRKELARLTGHTGPVNWVDLSADGKRAVSGGDDGNIFLWDLGANKEISHWKGSEKPISVVRFSPDGKGALSYGPDAKIHFWDLASRRETGAVEQVRPGDPGKPVTGAFLSADTALVGFTTTFGYWDLKNNRLTSSFGGGPVCAVAASGDGRLMAFAVEGATQFIVADEKRGGVFWPCGVSAVAPEGLSFAPDGRHILVGCMDGTVHYWAVNPDGTDGAATVTDAPGRSPPPAVVADKRAPLPVAEEVAHALEEIKTTFKGAYDNIHTPKDAYALSGKLLAEAHQSKDKPARQYALFVEARDLAARGEDLPTALEIIDETAAAYAIQVPEAKTAALLAAGKTFSNRAAAKAYLDAAFPVLEQARANDDYDLGLPLLPAVRQAYTDAQQPDLTKTASALVTQMEALQGEYKAVRPALATLKEKPDDADANLAAGKFYALRKQDWDKGAPLLAKGSDAALSEAALKEAGPPATAEEQTAAGDAWWKAGEKDAMFKSVLHRRALLWYDKALPDLTDKDVEERVRTRVIELTKQFPDFATAWADLDVSKVEVVGNCYLRLKPGQTVSTKQPATGALSVNVVARGSKSKLNFEMFTSYKEPKDKEIKELLVGWDVKDKDLGVHWLLRQGLRPSMQSLGTSAPVGSEAWADYYCDLREANTNFGVKGRTFNNPNKNDPTRARTFQVTAVGQVLEVQSFTVKPIAKP